MTLDVQEIRARAEQFESLLREELLQARAGLRTRPEFASLFGEHPDLGERDLLADVERAMAEADPEEEDRLRRLLEWVARHQVERALASLMDEYFAWEATTTVEVGGQETPLRQLPRVVASEDDASRRHALQRRAEGVLEDSVSLRLDILERERDAVRDLGYGAYLEALERLSRQSYRPLLERGRGVVRATESLYRHHLRAHLGRLGVEPGSATRGDELALRCRPFPEAGDATPSLGEARDLLDRDLGALDLAPAEGRVRFDVDRRPLKRPQSFCSAPEVPDRVVGVLAGFGGWSDVQDFLGVAGTALSLAHADPRLAFEDRYLGDAVMGYTYAALFRELASRPAWLERLEMPDDHVGSFARFAAWTELSDLRRDVARLDFELELWSEREAAGVVESFPRRIETATGFRPPPQAFLEVMGGGLHVARRVRGRLLGYRLSHELADRFGEDWFRNPAAGPFLSGLFGDGWRQAHARLRAEGGEDVALAARHFHDRLGETP